MDLDKFFPVWLNIVIAGLAIGFAIARHETEVSPLVAYPVTGFAVSITLIGWFRIF